MVALVTYCLAVCICFLLVRDMHGILHIIQASLWVDVRAIRPRAAGLHIGIECSGVRDSSWMYFTSLIIIRMGVGLAAVQRKLSDCVVVGL